MSDNNLEEENENVPVQPDVMDRSLSGNLTESEAPVVLSDEMTQNLREFIDICEQIKGAKDEMKIFTERKKELDGVITAFMLENGIPAFKTPNGRITVYETKSVKPLNKEYLKETIGKRITDVKMVEEITDLAFNNRESVSVQKIRVIPKAR